MMTTTTQTECSAKPCSLAAFMNAKGLSYIKPRYCDDGERCPGHPDWKPMRRPVACEGAIVEWIREIDATKHAAWFTCRTP